MFIGLIRSTVTPYEIKFCMDTATVEKLGEEDALETLIKGGNQATGSEDWSDLFFDLM